MSGSLHKKFQFVFKAGPVVQTVFWSPPPPPLAVSKRYSTNKNRYKVAEPGFWDF